MSCSFNCLKTICLKVADSQLVIYRIKPVAKSARQFSKPIVLSKRSGSGNLTAKTEALTFSHNFHNSKLYNSFRLRIAP